MAASNHREKQTILRLKIASSQDLRHFLRVIQPDFLRVVYPKESGLLDILYAAELITESDLESLSGKDVYTRKDQARKLFLLLNKMPWDEFQSKISPVLIKDFPHIIPNDFLTEDEVETAAFTEDYDSCLRHDIMVRIRLLTVSDLLYHHGYLTFEDYDRIASRKFDQDAVWVKLFTACKNDELNSSSPLVKGLQDLLQKYKLLVPDNLPQLMSQGFPCTCADGVEAVLLPSELPPVDKVDLWMSYQRSWSSTRNDLWPNGVAPLTVLNDSLTSSAPSSATSISMLRRVGSGLSWHSDPTFESDDQCSTKSAQSYLSSECFF